MPVLAFLTRLGKLMTLLYRAIFRVDFERCFELADKPGTIIKTILDLSKDHWEIVGPTNNHYQINAVSNVSAAKNRSAENFAVDTNAISGSIEIDQGVSLEEFLTGTYLSVCSEAMSGIMDRFEIRNFNRVGFRFFMTGGSVADQVGNREKVAARFRSFAVPPNVDARLIDVAMILVGRFDHDTEFRLHYGPGNESDLTQFLQRPLAKGIEAAGPHEYAADIDIYQQKLNFKGTNLLKWTKAKEPYIRDLLSIAAKSVGGAGDNA